MRKYVWSIKSASSSGVEAPAAIGAKYLRTLDALSRIDPLLSGWTLWRSGATLDDLLAWAEEQGEEPAPVKPVPIDAARRNIEEFVEANVRLDDGGEPQPDEGYTLVANNRYNGTPRNVCVSVTAGAELSLNSWSVTFGELGPNAPDPSLVAYPIMHGIFRTMTSIWPTPWARVQGSCVEYEERRGVIGMTSAETFRHDITWMGYLSAAIAPDFKPPADLASERTADGGVLMTAFQSAPDPSDTDQMRRSDVLGGIMDKYFPNPFPHLKRPPS